MLSDGVILLHDNTRTARKTQELLRKFKWEVLPPPYSPDSAPNLGSKHLSATRFSSESDVKTVVESWLNRQDVISAKTDEKPATEVLDFALPVQMGVWRLTASRQTSLDVRLGNLVPLALASCTERKRRSSQTEESSISRLTYPEPKGLAVP
ncbi:hypothetical protein AVEN_256403-1 [Araneus ventricosus]|uniref:Histone-lysine N-methyltransferase SETMAR n=1 Tax=Araneus ventricosus TaxID=182803 RepID=A0A4Y2FZ89_ARAVE|nr:hypothetical protein AVEN_256403-1 [Araneus ventricosus]